MTKAKKRTAVIAGIVAAGLVLTAIYALLPRSFAQVAASNLDLDIDTVEWVDILLDNFSDDPPFYTLTPEDPAFSDLLDLLERQHYFPQLFNPSHRSITLDYTITLVFDRGGTLNLTGDTNLYCSSARSQSYVRCNGGEALQQEILELLLAFVPDGA